ncbi:hypothetical protein SAMN06297251_11371 [Fulvimarina manganoxydans]|uniref:Glycosyl transferase family 2 n=1 Tax=Fulvimarina manganoxydans TaxID=937218 RepID=A0A1W2D9N9_9HYPH|nr:glycosyl transferase family 2 [Fulvimarina manganoxydans]SMC93708.1 hypothetical protein SAMN06297251_11371 [Fulvimarina manganoxydans]
MLSVFMDSDRDDRQLAVSLSPLVSAAVEGVVREVVLVDRGVGAAVREVADYCGCAIVTPGDLEHAFKTARSDWLFFMEPGSRPEIGWTRTVADHIEAVRQGRASPEAARLKPAPADRPGFLRRFRDRPSPIAQGLLLKKPQAVGLAKQRGAQPLADLAKGLATRRLQAEMRAKFAPGP